MLLGLGTAAAVSGGVLGTGALTSVQAERTVDIDVAGDADAFLGLTASGSNFVDEVNGAIRVRLNDNVGTSNGIGVNHGTGNGDVATTTIDPAFTITNQGADQLYVQISHTGVTSSGNDVEFIGTDDGDGDDVIADSNDPSFIDRADTSNAVTTELRSGGTATTIANAGHVNMGTTTSFDVTLQVASDSTTTGNIISNATIIATGDAGNLDGTEL